MTHEHVNPTNRVALSGDRHQMLQHVKDGGDPHAVDPGWSVGRTTRALHTLIRGGLIQATTTYGVTEAGARHLTVWDAQAEHEKWLAGQDKA